MLDFLQKHGRRRLLAAITTTLVPGSSLHLTAQPPLPPAETETSQVNCGEITSAISFSHCAGLIQIDSHREGLRASQ